MQTLCYQEYPLSVEYSIETVVGANGGPWGPADDHEVCIQSVMFRGVDLADVLTEEELKELESQIRADMERKGRKTA